MRDWILIFRVFVLGNNALSDVDVDVFSVTVARSLDLPRSQLALFVQTTGSQTHVVFQGFVTLLHVDVFRTAGKTHQRRSQDRRWISTLAAVRMHRSIWPHVSNFFVDTAATINETALHLRPLCS
ncbi:uncharacterized protein F5891DRAFT_548180 [Suillus fuscotomentosus]|uniref:Secreted protein n=1 Tax=Suillus fuscotomentosus TaxID=1912939 RepID=A0AAD4E2M3_9AGAM|nr:uncharacterized protein F5891DRAFT_548180 [Suillus fuscotomentosus]KAG1897153.1 hypothetical protein F5891DRAFT_548180 [Suillus fuscotomentosus]